MSRHGFGPIVLLALLLHPDGGVALRALPGAADGPRAAGKEPSRPDRDPAKRLEEYKHAAALYTIDRDSNPPAKLTLRPEPVFRWNSPPRTAYDGVLFIWTLDGRPEAAANFYRNTRNGAPFEQHEFQSLSIEGLTATYTGRPAWASQVPGLAPEAIQGAPAPGKSPSARPRQLLALAKEFRGEVTERKVKSPLRLLEQPLYRYEDTGDATGRDGALFALVHASDPEILLLIEERQAGEAPAWHFAMARMSGWTLQAWHKDRLVWEPGPLNGSYHNIPAPEQPH